MTLLPEGGELWRLYNLRGSPFFQEALDPAPDAVYPIDLFVGREGDATRYIRWIESHPSSSRNVVAGAPGTGKTTLVQYIKDRVPNLISASRPVSVGPSDGEEEVALRIIDYVYRAIVARGDFTTHDNAAMKSARALVRTFPVTSRSGGLSGGYMGMSVGASASAGTSYVTAAAKNPSLLIETLLPELLGFAREHVGADGCLVHLDNMEHLADADAARAAATLRALRDRCLLLDGFHWLVVGTTESVDTVIRTHSQVRSVFPVYEPLGPLSVDDVVRLLERRYAHLVVPGRTPLPPVMPEVVRAVYALFNGDLRGTLQALDAAVTPLLGYAEGGPHAPLTAETIAPTLRRIYGDQLARDLGEEEARRLESFIDATSVDPEGTTIRVLEELWKTSYTTANETVKRLVEAGYLAPTTPTRPPTGRPAMRYGATGASRLALLSLMGPDLRVR
ncbi:MAG TPA: hypothetical protein VFT96_06045 [Gemmatimonadaceae bacterium]|nr:hypothetical protein [Gemmatimonadaceae bacterium]